MVAAVPKHLVDKYGHWVDKIPAAVLADLTEDQVHGRLRRAQARMDAATGVDGDGDWAKAMTDAGEILAAPAPTAKKTGPSALKAAGITGDDMAEHGPMISRIPDDVLAKMDRPSVVKRAEVAAAEYARTGRLDAADRILAAPAYVQASAPMTVQAAAAYRRGVREDIARKHGRWIAEVPDEVLGKLDAAELLDRCEHAADLQKRGEASPHPGLIHGYLDRARKVLAALPAGEVEAEAARLEKAALVSDYPQLAQGHRARAQELREANPQAPVKARPGEVGKALRPTPKPPVPFIAKAAPATPPAAPVAPRVKPARVRRASLSKADSQRLGAGLDALEAALLLLRDGVVGKADGVPQDTVVEILDRADDLFSGRVQQP